MPDTCPDCQCAEGELHELFCSKERCPFCQNQLSSCDCIYTVLGLSEEETRVVEEYIDDSEQPLKDIVERWVNALNAKGRIPC